MTLHTLAILATIAVMTLSVSVIWSMVRQYRHKILAALFRDIPASEMDR